MVKNWRLARCGYRDGLLAQERRHSRFAWGSRPFRVTPLDRGRRAELAGDQRRRVEGLSPVTRIYTRLAAVAATLALSGGAAIAVAPTAIAETACWRAIVTAEDYAGQAASHAGAGRLATARDLGNTALSYTYNGNCETSPGIGYVEDARGWLNYALDATWWGDAAEVNSRFRLAVQSLEEASYEV